MLHNLASRGRSRVLLQPGGVRVAVGAVCCLPVHAPVCFRFLAQFRLSHGSHVGLLVGFLVPPPHVPLRKFCPATQSDWTVHVVHVQVSASRYCVPEHVVVHAARNRCHARLRNR